MNKYIAVACPRNGGRRLRHIGGGAKSSHPYRLDRKLSAAWLCSQSDSRRSADQLLPEKSAEISHAYALIILLLISQHLDLISRNLNLAFTI